MSRRILVLVVIILVFALVGGATYSSFTATATSSASTFTAGKVAVDIERNAGDPVPGPMFYSTREQGNVGEQDLAELLWPTGEWVPGDSHMRLLNVKNTGTMPFRISGLAANLYNVTPEQYAELAEYMKVKVYYNVPGNPILYSGSLGDYLDGPVATLFRPPGAVNSVIHLNFEVALNIDAGNEVQGIEPKIDFFLHVEQVANNPYTQP